MLTKAGNQTIFFDTRFFEISVIEMSRDDFLYIFFIFHIDAREENKMNKIIILT